MKKIVLTFGFIAGGLLSLMFVATWPFHDKLLAAGLGEVVGYTTMVIALLMVFFGVRSYRDNVGNGQVSFGRAFKVGILITAITTLCYVATWLVMYYTVASDFAEKYAATVIAKERSEGASEEKIAAIQAKMDKYGELMKNPFINAAFVTLEIFPVGLLATLVSAAILRRRNGLQPSPA
jgi:hypothetical protein